MKYINLLSVIIFNSCLVLPQKYLNDESIESVNIYYKVKFNEIENDKLYLNLNDCKLFLETSTDIKNKLEFNKSKLESIRLGINRIFSKVQSFKENDSVYFISLKEIYCNDEFTSEDRKSEIMAQNLLAYSLLGLIPILTERDHVFEVEIKDSEYKIVDKFYSVYVQKSIFSIFLAPFSFIEMNEKRRSKIIDGISEKIFLDIYFRLNRHSKIN